MFTTKEGFMVINDIVRQKGKTPDKLLGVLLEYQKTKNRNYLTNEDLKDVAKKMNLPESRVYSVATFYSLLSVKPRGKYVIQLCRDVPCYVNGAFDIREELETALQISVGETTKDGLFSLEFASCLGCCEMAPVMRIDQKIYGHLNRKKLAEIIAEYRRL
jgi:NADH-quinone oxidoreductase subunit E